MPPLLSSHEHPQVDSVLSDDLRHQHTFDSGLLSAYFVGVVVSATALGSYYAVVQLTSRATFVIDGQARNALDAVNLIWFVIGNM